MTQLTGGSGDVSPSPATTYGQLWADVYDEVNPGVAVDSPEIRLLQYLAGGGRVLELGVGTGRLAIPLRATGVDVTGLDASQDMLNRLRAKPGGEEVAVVRADMTLARIEPAFAMVYLAGSTIFGPLTRDAQMATLRTAASALISDGSVVVECFVPDQELLDRLPAAEHKARDQVIHSRRHVPGGPSSGLPVSIRYLFPHELDDLAASAGLVLQERLGGWDRSAFTEESRYHVSIYRRRSSVG